MADDGRSLAGFVGALPFAPPRPVAPAAGDVVPHPQRYDRGPLVGCHDSVVSLTGPETPVAVVGAGLWRRGIRWRTGGDGYPVRFAIDSSVDRPEGYRIDATSEAIAVTAGTEVGLVWGAATARQLLLSGPNGLQVATGVIEDWPVVPLRMLAGWGLYRAHHMEWAIEVAIEGKFNRVLYNWWTATADETLGRREAELTAMARRHGIELVLELRRQALGPGFSLSDTHAIATLLRHYDDAVDRGFKVFGFLFDDTDHDPFADEFALLRTIVDHLTDRLGEEPEFYFCPRFYWFPGQMDYSWMGAAQPAADDGGPSMTPMLGATAPRSMDEAIDRQEQYLREMASALPARTNVYLANWWSSTPDSWRQEVQDEWTGPVGRPPVFWDNQQMNDYRAGVVLPIPLHQRPAGFAHALTGYTLNSSPPLSTYAPSSITAGAWAWNPDGYDAGGAFGAAIAAGFPGAEREAIAFLAAWCDLFDELMAPRGSMEQHYRNVRDIGADRDRADALRSRFDQLVVLLNATAAALAPTAHAMARDALATFAQEIDRLRLDLRLAELVARPDTPGAREEADALLAALEDVLVSRLPPVPELVEAARHGFSDTPIPGVSWHLHFVAGPMRAGPRRLARSLEKRLPASG